MSWIELVRWHLDSQYYREREKKKKSLLLLRYIGEPSLFIFIYFLFLFYYYTFLFFLYISSYSFFFLYFVSLVLSRIRPSVERLTRRPPSPHEPFTPQRALGDGANDDRKGSTPELYRFSPAPVETSSNPAQVKQYIYWIYIYKKSRTMNPCRSLYMYYYFLFLLSFYVLFFFHIFLSIWLFLPFFFPLFLFSTSFNLGRLDKTLNAHMTSDCDGSG